MADEAFALSPINARAALPSEADYDAIREAFMETSRGRWFLTEYSKRNRNADTHMVLEAVARIEQTIAAQKQAPANPLVDALGAIRTIVADARARASEVLLRSLGDETLEAARDGARIVREVAWTLRECGADVRICDLLDAQIGAIDTGHRQLAAPEHREALLACFDQLMLRIGELADPNAAPTASEEAAAPQQSRATQAAAAPEQAQFSAEAVAEPEAMAAPVASAEPDTMAKPETTAAPEAMAAQETSAAPEMAEAEAKLEPVIAEPATAADPVAVAAPIAATIPALGSEALPTAAAISTAPEMPAAEAILPPVSFDAPAEFIVGPDPDIAADQRAIEDSVAEEILVEDIVVEDDGEHPIEETAQERAVLDAISLEMAEPDFSESESDEPASAASEIAELTAMTLQPAPVQQVAAPEPVAPPTPQPSLGAALIARGMVAKAPPTGPDLLAPIRRMSQAERIAFFS
jgi:chemotaxis protein histidine kinase CheA